MAALIYRLGIVLYTSVIRLAAIFGNTKAKQWIAGRQGIFSKLHTAFSSNTSAVIWLHCASLGEFEQGRPLIEAIKQKHPQYKILLTFFSPSGYEVRHNYPLADWVFYLPSDSAAHAKQFLSITQPKIAIFVKYEFWHFYLQALQQQQIPTYLISAIFRPQQIFFRWYGGFFRNMLFCFDHIFVQDKNSIQLLQQVNYTNTIRAGDTRLDRVLSIKKQAKAFPIIKKFTANHPVLIAGSTWQPGEALLAKFAHKKPEYRLVIAPHQIDEAHINALEHSFPKGKAIRYSQATTTTDFGTAQVLIIDNIGMLSSLYAYGHIAYIGGGFGAGIHNTLEAAVFQIPILFGHNYHKFKEAKDLIQAGVAFEIADEAAITKVAEQIQQASIAQEIQQKAQTYLQQNEGATSVILEHIVLP